MARRSDLPWPKIRRAYMVSGNVSGTAARFGISRQVLHGKIASEGWHEKRLGLLRRATKKADQDAEVSVADRMRDHAQLAGIIVADLAQLRADVMQDPNVSFSSKVETMRSLVDGLQRSSKMHFELLSRVGDVDLPIDSEPQTTEYTVVIKRQDGAIVDADSSPQEVQNAAQPSASP